VVLNAIRAEWRSVESTRDFIARNLAAAHTGVGSMGVSHEFRNLTYSLWLLFAFSVLERALLELRSELIFSSKNSGLEQLMRNSQRSLRWQNYALVNIARKRRNDVAHRRTVLQRADCWKYVAALGSELRAWKIIL
jgi:hypothetical protein